MKREACFQCDLDIPHVCFHGMRRPGEPIGCAVCRHLSCVCKIKRAHRPWCRFRRAATGPVGIACLHDRDVCPTCDRCTCKQKYTVHLTGSPS